MAKMPDLGQIGPFPGLQGQKMISEMPEEGKKFEFFEECFQTCSKVSPDNFLHPLHNIRCLKHNV